MAAEGKEREKESNRDIL